MPKAPSCRTFPSIDPKLLPLPDAFLRAINVVALALPDHRRLVAVGRLPKREEKEFYGYFVTPTRTTGIVQLSLGIPRISRLQTLLHELGHALQWGISGPEAQGHDLGFGCAWSIVYRIHLGEIASILTRGDGRLQVVYASGECREYSG